MRTELITRDNYDLSNREYYEIGFLKDSISDSKDRTDKVINTVADAICTIDSVKKIKDSKDEFKLVADISPELMKELKEGTKKLDECGEKIYAQIRDKNGNWGEKIALKKVPSEIPIDPVSLSMAMQMKAIEQKLDDIVDTLEIIGKSVERVREGQENDRIGLYLSGINLYIEANTIKESTLRTLVVSQAIKSISDACSQEMQSAASDVKYLIEKRYLELPKGRTNEVNNRIRDINKCLEIIHKATLFKAGIYYREGELDAMLEVFGHYARFLDAVIISNAGKLAELDSTERRIDSSKWSKKKDILLSINEIKSQIGGETTLYIEGDCIHV